MVGKGLPATTRYTPDAQDADSCAPRAAEEESDEMEHREQEPRWTVGGASSESEAHAA